MSMLAERKRKQKFSLNPQGNSWNNERNAFGKKMLERMGWKEGKGLGRNEDGRTNHVKVSFKNDTNGMGFKETDESSVHQDDFNTLLRELSNSNDASLEKPQELKSLEAKSQNSRARVHYKKYTRGKDLSRYSEKDLANIFGKKKLQADATVVEDSVVTNDEISAYGVKAIPRGSMTDYFRNKCNGFGFGYGGTKYDSNCTENNDEGTETILKIKKEETFVSYIDTEGNNSETTLKKKKRKHLLEELDECCTPKKQKKDKSNKNCKGADLGNKKPKQEPEELGLINPAFNPLSTNVTIKKHVLDTIAENDCEIDLNESVNCEEKVKRKKKKHRPTPDTDRSTNEEPAELSMDLKENSNKKSKRKVKDGNQGLDNPAFDLLNQNVEATSENDSNITTSNKKKKKKSKHSEQGIENPSFAFENTTGSSDVITENNPYEEKPKKKKKKSGSYAIDNPSFNMNGDLKPSQSSEQYEVKRKNKKSKGLDNPALDLNHSNENCTPLNDTESSVADIPDCDIMMNITDEAEKKTPFSKAKTVRFSNVNQSGSAEDFSHRKNELFDINTKVIQDGLKKHKKGKYATSPDGSDFDIKSVDDIDFCNDGSSKLGQDNRAFDAKAQRVEESVNQLSNDIDHYQAEIENGINETKLKIKLEEVMVGEINDSDGENEPHKDGVKLRFKHARFNKYVPHWARKNDASTSWPKKSYKHLIRGDVIIGFKNTNLHTINGYGSQKTPGF